MYLSDRDIRKAIEDGSILIEGFDETRLQPASYDILLGNKFIVHNTQSTPAIDPVKKIYPEPKEIIISEEEGVFILHPGVNILGTSIDYFGSDKYLIQLSGKSSLARIGLVIHNTAGIINPGHFLNITFELCNMNQIPIILRPKMRIGQILFSELSSKPIKDYKNTGRYHGRDWQHFVDPKEEEITITKLVNK
ncbi:dCTP deaminase [Patescibacteria group bacterium]|nr:dCTP deaminase [Patescibacteria group bacterium]MDE1946423.1 dCTP deaminase [Patescibacteria group bacterium]MDE2011032.1 dCTP deaminase [Patescibacteria group bacterium]MDE2233622.1 dCTP deaminase [Patescibacteria group bacterium]